MLEKLSGQGRLLRVAAASFAVAAIVWTMTTRGLALGLLVLAALALIVVIALIWASVQSLTGGSALTLDDALSLAAPRAEEEQKRAVLRALKDLEYERSVGKITDEDYAELSARYRQQAKELLRSLDESLAPSRDRVEALLERRVAGDVEVPAKLRKKKRKSPPAEPTEAESPPEAEPAREVAAAPAIDEDDPDDELDDEDSDAEELAPMKASAPTRRCVACDVRNELDARFCKGCGKPLAAEGEHACTACPARYDAARDACPDCGVERSDA